MEIPPIQDNAAKHRFEIQLPDGDYAYVAYRQQAQGLALTHTEVPVQWEGQGIASSLARQVLDLAREQSVKVLPYCPYVSVWLQRHPDYQDLVPENFDADED